MKVFIFTTRYRIASALINLGILAMPECEYKRELLRRLWELRVDIEMAVMNKENDNGNQ